MARNAATWHHNSVARRLGVGPCGQSLHSRRPCYPTTGIRPPQRQWCLLNHFRTAHCRGLSSYKVRRRSTGAARSCSRRWPMAYVNNSNSSSSGGSIKLRWLGIRFSLDFLFTNNLFIIYYLLIPLIVSSVYLLPRFSTLTLRYWYSLLFYLI